MFTVAPLHAQEWETVPLAPPTDNRPDRIFLEVYFLPSNPLYGWVVGFSGHTLRTTDGGRTWQRGYTPIRYDSLKTTVPIIRRDTIRMGDSVIIRDTTIGLRDTVLIQQDARDFVGHLEGVMFADSLVGYCSGPAGIFKSVDGGRTWFDVEDSTVAPGTTWGVWCASRDTVYVMGGGCGDDVQRFYRSTNGGRTWSVFLGRESNSGLADAHVESSRGAGYAASSGVIWRTGDGGRTWQPMATTAATSFVNRRDTIPTNVWHEDFQMMGSSMLVSLSGNQCAGGGSQLGGARFSLDSGKTWREYQMPSTAYGVFLLDKLRGWVFGSRAGAAYTGDGGQTWQIRNCGIPDSIDLDDGWFVNDTLGIAVGGDGGLIGNVYRYVPPRERVPLASVNPSSARACVTEGVTLTAPAGWAYYAWSTGDTTRSITVRQSGRYSVRTCTRGSDTVTVTIDPLPEARISLSSQGRVCEGDSVRLQAVSPIPSNRYSWSFGGNVVGQGVSLVAKQSGVYTLNVESGLGCRAASTATVTIFPRPITTITAQRPPQFCLMDSTILEAPEGFVRYEWRRITDGQLAPNIARTRSLTTQQSGLYSVQLTDANGCTWQSNTIDVTALNFNKQLFIASRLSGGAFIVDSTVLGERRCVEMRLVNVDPLRDVRITGVFMARNTEFSVPLAQFPLVVPARSERTLQICFAPRTQATRRDTIFVADSCGTVPVPLVGFGRPDTLVGISRCGPEVMLRSIGSAQARLVISQPAPNPASTLIAAFTQRTAPEQMQAESPVAAVYTLMGEEVARVSYVLLRRRSENGIIVDDGELTADIQRLPVGTYMLVVRDGNGAVTFPVLVSR